MKNNNPVVDALAKAVKGLLYISESESDMKPFVWEAGDLSKERLLKLAGAPKGTAVEEAALDTFFQTISKEDKPKFAGLTKVIQEQLTGTKVYKVGNEAERQLYVVGKTRTGEWAGIKTTVVET